MLYQQVTNILLQLLGKLLFVCSKEDLSYTDDGIEAILFTAQGDMRQALNNLQSTAQGFGHVSSENVFKVSLLNENSICIEWVLMFANPLKCYHGS